MIMVDASAATLPQNGAAITARTLKALHISQPP
jgi:hypothetical protein